MSNLKPFFQNPQPNMYSRRTLLSVGDPLIIRLIMEGRGEVDMTFRVGRPYAPAVTHADGPYRLHTGPRLFGPQT